MGAVAHFFGEDVGRIDFTGNVPHPSKQQPLKELGGSAKPSGLVREMQAATAGRGLAAGRAPRAPAESQAATPTKAQPTTE